MTDNVISFPGSTSSHSSHGHVEGALPITSHVSNGSHGSLKGVLTDVVAWLERYISVADNRDLELLALWAAHTHMSEKFYTTPRLIIDSAMPGSGKTTVLEHLMRLAHHPVQAASISSPALLARLIAKEPRTILIDEADRSLDPKKPGVDELIAVINSGYKKGGTRPVLVPVKGGEWVAEEMSTFAPVAMAGNSPTLPDDTRSRSLRIVLMPDIEGRAQESDWEEIEAAGLALGQQLADTVQYEADIISAARPVLPSECRGRAKERWAPLARIAFTAGAPWDRLVTDLITRDMAEVAQERHDGLSKVPPAVTLLHHLHAVWPESQAFMRSNDLINLLVQHDPHSWSETSNYGKRLNVQRLGRMLSQSTKVYSVQRHDGARGYQRDDLLRVWTRFGLGGLQETVKTVRDVRTDPAGGVS